jgi:hypothetical protein
MRCSEIEQNNNGMFIEEERTRMVQVRFLFIRVNMVCAILTQGVELPRVVKYTVVPTLKVQELLKLATEHTRR